MNAPAGLERSPPFRKPGFEEQERILRPPVSSSAQVEDPTAGALAERSHLVQQQRHRSHSLSLTAGCAQVILENGVLEQEDRRRQHLLATPANAAKRPLVSQERFVVGRREAIEVGGALRAEHFLVQGTEVVKELGPLAPIDGEVVAPGFAEISAP